MLMMVVASTIPAVELKPWVTHRAVSAFNLAKTYSEDQTFDRQYTTVRIIRYAPIGYKLYRGTTILT